MTSPASNNGQKDNSAKTSNSTLATSSGRDAQQARSTPPFTAWWRVFKLANLMMQPKC